MFCDADCIKNQTRLNQMLVENNVSDFKFFNQLWCSSLTSKTANSCMLPSDVIDNLAHFQRQQFLQDEHALNQKGINESGINQNSDIPESPELLHDILQELSQTNHEQA